MPAVWWISRRIREDRERCGDDIAVEICGDPLVSATAPAELATSSRRARLALAATDGALLNRVRRVLGESTSHSSAGAGSILFLVALVMAGAVVAARATSPKEILTHDMLLSGEGGAPAARVPPPTVDAAGPATARVWPAQQPARNVFRVRVVDGVTAEPVEGVEVGVRCFDAFPRSTRFTNAGIQTTDARGEFVFDALEPGVCIVMNALKPGFSQRLMENTRPNEVGAGETMRVIRIWRHSSVAGSVLDERRQPIANTPVYLNGLKAVTDAQGRYAFPSLVGSTDSFPATTVTYTVSVPDIELAQPAPSIVLAPGEGRTGVDLIGTRRPRATLSGRVTDQSGMPIVQLSLYLDHGASPENHPVVAAVVTSDADGRFRFPDVPRGQYRVRADSMAVARPPASLAPVTIPTYWAIVPATLDRDVADFPVIVRSMPQIHGSVRFEGYTTYPGFNVLLGVWGLDGSGGRVTNGGNIRADMEGRFSAGGFRPGRYLIRASGVPGGWRVLSAMTDGRDISSVPLDLTSSAGVNDLVVTLTRRQTSVEGVVRTAEGQPDREASVIAFSTDPQLWNGGNHVEVSKTSQRGDYGVAGLRPGDYFIAAVSSDTQGFLIQGADPELLRRLVPLASRIRLDYDVTVTRDLTRVTP
jgi:protocatechuate 3,4-dioxygenase beta subunit